MTAPPDYAAFVATEHRRLVGALTLYCGDRDTAEELAQDTLVRCREQWRRVSSADRPGAYAHRVAINLANSSFRRRAAERRAVAKVAMRTDGNHTDPCSADGLAVRRAVSSLPPRQREVIVRRFFLDESAADVATAMGIAPGTVASTTRRALDALRETFDITLPAADAVLTITEARDGA